MLKGGDFEKRLVSRTADGSAIQPLYTRADAVARRGASPARTALLPRRLGHPPAPCRARCRRSPTRPSWRTCTGGATSLLLQITAPGQAGLAYGAEALATALKGVFLDACAIALDARENTMDAAGSLIELWRAANVSENAAARRLQLRSARRAGRDRHALLSRRDRSCEIAAKLAADCRTMTHVTALLADGRPYHEAGASEAQELAAMLATLVAYLRACEAAGLQAAHGASARSRSALAADADLFLTMAKLRAARRLVARVADACGAAHARSTSMHLTATTSERMMARRDPWVNMLRTTVACAGAAFGGADAITVLPFTWALGRPDAFARRIARNTHLVLQEESALGRVIDPAARRLGRREADRGSGRQGLGAVPGHRGQGRHGARAGERLHPGRDRQGRRGARRDYRHGPPGADGRLGLSAAGR